MSHAIITVQAEEDIIEIWFYIAVENKSRLNADRFINKMEKQISFLADNPNVGTLQNQYKDGLYQFVFNHYLIFYFPLKSGGIEVIRILHGMRDIGRLFE